MGRNGVVQGRERDQCLAKQTDRVGKVRIKSWTLEIRQYERVFRDMKRNFGDMDSVYPGTNYSAIMPDLDAKFYYPLSLQRMIAQDRLQAQCREELPLLPTLQATRETKTCHVLFNQPQLPIHSACSTP